MKSLITRDMMTVKQVADILEKDESTIRKIGKELYPDVFRNGITTYLNEAQVTAIKLNLGKNSELPKTKLEKQLIIRQAMQLQQEMIAELQAENEVMKPKALAYDQFISSDEAVDMAIAAKNIFGDKVGRNTFMKKLRECGILLSNNTPRQEYMKYFKVVQVPKPIGDKVVNFPTTLVMPEGIIYLSGKFNPTSESIQ